MRPLDDNGEIAGRKIAIIAEILYLMNLLATPGVAFIGLLYLYKKHGAGAGLAGCHIRQAIIGSVCAGILLAIVTMIMIALGGFASPWTWVVVLTYFVTCHSGLVLLGMFGLAKAMAGKSFVIPFIGGRCDE